MSVCSHYVEFILPLLSKQPNIRLLRAQSSYRSASLLLWLCNSLNIQFISIKIVIKRLVIAGYCWLHQGMSGLLSVSHGVLRVRPGEIMSSHQHKSSGGKNAFHC